MIRMDMQHVLQAHIAPPPAGERGLIEVHLNRHVPPSRGLARDESGAISAAAAAGATTTATAAAAATTAAATAGCAAASAASDADALPDVIMP